MGIEVSVNETRCLCSLPVVDARRFTSRLPWPPATLLVSNYPFRPRPTPLVLPSVSQHAQFDSSCQRSCWLISDKTRSAMKRNLADRNVVKPSDAKTHVSKHMLGRQRGMWSPTGCRVWETTGPPSDAAGRLADMNHESTCPAHKRSSNATLYTLFTNEGRI